MTQWARAPQSREQMVLFAERLDEAVPSEHAVRLLDEMLSGLDWSKWEAAYHARLGQPAIHPRVLSSVLLYGLMTDGAIWEAAVRRGAGAAKIS
jgi:transposase